MSYFLYRRYCRILFIFIGKKKENSIFARKKYPMYFLLILYLFIFLYRCKLWKEALGFSANHKYANFSVDQCNSTIRVCSLHFTEDSFCTSSSSNRKLLSIDAVPLIFNQLTRVAETVDESVERKDISENGKHYLKSCRNKLIFFF